MNPRRIRIFPIYLVLLILTGCCTFYREAFLAQNGLEKFTTDRPGASALLKEHASLRQWIEIEWSKQISGYRLYWSDNEPVISMAEHGFMPELKLIVIRVSKNLSPGDQLTSIVFEICNAREFADIDELAAQVVGSRISREDYIEKKCRKEFEAVLRVQGIFRDLVPISMTSQGFSNLYQHLMQTPNNFKAYEEKNATITDSNYKRGIEYYGIEYDKLAGRRRHP